MNADVMYAALGAGAGVIITILVLLALHVWVAKLMAATSAEIHEVHLRVSQELAKVDARTQQAETSLRLLMTGMIAPSAPQGAGRPTGGVRPMPVTPATDVPQAAPGGQS